MHKLRERLGPSPIKVSSSLFKLGRVFDKKLHSLHATANMDFCFTNHALYFLGILVLLSQAWLSKMGSFCRYSPSWHAVFGAVLSLRYCCNYSAFSGEARVKIKMSDEGE